MEEILSEFRHNQLHFRKTILFSMVIVLSFVLVTVFYLESKKLSRSSAMRGSPSMGMINVYSIVSELVSTTTDSVTFKLIDGSGNQNYSAYLDEKTINKLSKVTKSGDVVRIYSKTSISEDKDGFVISKIENYIK